MGNKQKTESISGGIISFSTVLFAIIGYFVYGGLDGMLAMLLFILATELFACLGFIPIVGPLFYIGSVQYLVYPVIFEITGITSTWLTELVFFVGLAESILFTVLMTSVWIILSDIK